MAQDTSNADGGTTDQFGDINVINPSDIDGDANAGTGAAGSGSGDNGGSSYGEGTGERKKRKRRTREEIERDKASGGEKRSGTQTQTQVKANIETTTAVLFSAHQMLAQLLQDGDVLISEDQAKAEAVAIAHVQSFYPNKANAKALAWANLAMIAAAVNGPIIVKMIKKQQRQASQQTHRNISGQLHGLPAA